MVSEKRSKINLHSSIATVMKNYRGIGMGTPSAMINKCSMLFDESYTHHKIAIVVIDAIRCSTTLLACLGAGVKAATITVKGGEKGTSLETARQIATHMNLQMVTAGELNGLPIPGGLIGNSPAEAAACVELHEKFLHFQSTNFGSVFSEVALIVNEFLEMGGAAEIYVASFVNAAAVAKEISMHGYDRVLISCGGFYDSVSLEDNLVGGQILYELSFAMNELDDEAREMLTAFQTFNTPAKQYGILNTNWISRSLAAFGREDDVKTVLWGEGIALPTYNRMKNLVPKVEWIENIAVIKSNLNGEEYLQADNIVVLPKNIKWEDVLRGMPLGSQAAVIEGNPKKSGFFTLRHKIPANWVVMPHTHPADEHITVLEGSCYLGIGKEYSEEAATKLSMGAFTMMKAGTAHYFFTKENCIIQVHGMGPQKINYINPDDDPRAKNGVVKNNLITLNS